jgi:predicted enzyme related to lactoylglutathione lyase
LYFRQTGAVWFVAGRRLWRSVSTRVAADLDARCYRHSAIQITGDTEKKKTGKPVVHFEIGCRDSAKTQAFYGQLFDWDITQAGPAATINTGAEGINGHITALGHEPFNYVTVYVQVDDLQAYLDKATALGGKTLVKPCPFPPANSPGWPTPMAT